MNASEDEEPSDANKSPPKNGWHLAHLGVQYGVTLILFTGIGYALDEKIQCTKPLLTIVGAFSGFALGLYFLIRKL